MKLPGNSGYGPLVRLAVISALASLALLAASPACFAQERFQDKGNGTVLDTKTGLVWLKDANMAKARIPLQTAKELIRRMNSGESVNFGFDDWRIPTVDEMLSLVDEARHYPALPSGHMFVNPQNDFYWTGSGGTNVIGYVWMVDVASGNVMYDFISYCNFLYLWPVRGEGRDLPSAQKLPSPAELDLSMGAFKCEDASKPPSAPGGLTATAVSTYEVSLSWGPSSDAGQTAWFNVYENETFIKSVPTPFASVTGIKPGETKCYRVSAFSSSGVESQLSGKVCTKTWTKAAKSTVWSAGTNQFGQLGDGALGDSGTLVVASGLSDAVKVSAGVEHAVAVKSDGTVWAWGRNLRGQLGDGSTKNSPKPVKVKDIEGVVDADAGWYHTIALKSDGTVWAWGRNYYGQLGNGDNADRSTPVQVRGLGSVVAIDAGWYHSLALTADGTVYAWGWNLKGQLGNDSMENSYSPTEVMGLRNITKISAGMYHSMALMSDGTVWAWGWNEYGQLGSGNVLDSLIPVMVKNVSGVDDVSAGMHHSLALKSDGKVLAWGRNDSGQLGAGEISQATSPVLLEGLDGVKAARAGAYHSAALKNDGTLWIWGWDYAGKQKDYRPRQSGGMAGITAVSAGMHFTSVIREE